jgi:hypothetical protein
MYLYYHGLNHVSRDTTQIFTAKSPLCENIPDTFNAMTLKAAAFPKAKYHAEAS